MNSEREALHVRVKGMLGGSRYDSLFFRVERLVTLYLEYAVIRDWLEDNRGLAGEKGYKENFTALNSLMQNIRNLEDDLELFKDRRSDGASNGLLDLVKRGAA